MARAVLRGLVADTAGSVIRSATVKVCDFGTTNLISDTVYATATSVVPISPTLTSDSQTGTYEAWIAGPGRRVTVVASGGTPAITTPVSEVADFTTDFGEVVTKTDVQTVSGKTLSAPIILGNGTLSGAGSLVGNTFAFKAKLTDAGGQVKNVMHPRFGAVGDGVTDDTAAIQAALDLGGTVWIPEPSVGYKITSTLTIGNGNAQALSTVQSLRVHGQGIVNATPSGGPPETTLHGFSKLLWYGAASGTMLRILGPIQQCEIRGLGFDCRSIASTGIQAFDFQASRLEHCKVLNYLDAAYDIRAYAYGDASPNDSNLASNNGGNNSLFALLYAFSQSPTAVGLSLGSPTAPATDGTVAGIAVATGPDVSQCTFVNCTFRHDGAGAAAIGLRLRFADQITFLGCTFASGIPIQVDPPSGSTAFPNGIIFYNCPTDNGNHSGADCTITGAWTATGKLQFLPFPEPMVLSQMPPKALGWGMTHGGGMLNDYTFRDNVAISGSLTVADIGASGGIGATGPLTAGTKLFTGGSSVLYTESLFEGTLATNATTSFAARMGKLHLINFATGDQCEVFLMGAGATVRQASVGIVGFSLTDAGVTIAIYWDGSAYQLKNRSATNPVRLYAFFEGRD